MAVSPADPMKARSVGQRLQLFAHAFGLDHSRNAAEPHDHAAVASVDVDLERGSPGLRVKRPSGWRLLNRRAGTTCTGCWV